MLRLISMHVSTVIVFYDGMITLPDEVTHIWFGRHNAALYLYLATRYLA